MVAERQHLGRLYDQLSRYEWWRRRLAAARPGTRLELRKRLREPADLDAWLHQRTAPRNGASVLDLGCGFGGTLFHFARCGQVCTGLTLSGYQANKARLLAERFGLAARCAIRQQSFDEAIEGSFDVVLAVDGTSWRGPRLLCAGRHTREKSQDRIIRIFARHTG